MSSPVPAPAEFGRMHAFAWRPMTQGDLDGTIAVAAVVHPAFPERREVFAERLSLFPEGCLVLGAPGGGVAGYAVSHPWHDGRPVPLDTLLVAMPVSANRYIHDVAIMPGMRGGGFAGQVVGRIVKDAYRAGATTVSLVAVSGSGPFWERHGFRPVSDAGLTARLASYGDDARFMVRSLGQ